ncbi:MAG TPA: acylneuraminate cytidylyltransferase family protein [Terriglobia bacterium]|nr:acylneuraminate cytidylyltransferase family protein [Terriglobia bacterium]
MIEERGLLAVIPARGGSRGLAGKNIRTFAGLPLIAHSILLAKMCREVDRLIVSTDDPAIAAVAREFGADVPFLRPADLAQDDTPLWPVLRHALDTVQRLDDKRYRYLMLLDPTSPTRLPEDVTAALRRLSERPEADGIIGVSQPDFNPLWHCVVEKDGWMGDLINGASSYDRRQDVPVVYRINGTLYIWRTAFVRTHSFEWRDTGRYLMHSIPDIRAVSIDNIDEFRQAELMVTHGFVQLPWLEKRKPSALA